MPFHFILVKWVFHKLYIFQFQIFDTNWPSLLNSNKKFLDAPENEKMWSHLDMGTLELPEEWAVVAEDGHVEPVAVAVTNQNISRI